MTTLLITLVHYPDDPELAETVAKNRARFCKLGGGFIIFKELPEVAKDLAPSWSRVPMFIEALKAYDRVLWLDADAVLMQDVWEKDLPGQLAFAHDGGGINDGVTVTVKKDLAMWKILWEARSLYAGTELHQQKMIHDMNPIHTILPLDVWNNRWESNWSYHFARVCHFPFGPDKWNLVKKVIRKLEGVA